jgi:hypothetical protein
MVDDYACLLPIYTNIALKKKNLRYACGTFRNNVNTPKIINQIINNITILKQ